MMREKATWRHRWATQVGCDQVAPHLAATSGTITELGRREQRHAGQCLRCQAELAQHRKLVRSLHGLRLERMDPPPEYVADVMAALDEEPDPARTLLSARRVAYASGLAAATAAGAVSAIVFTARSRRARLVG